MSRGYLPELGETLIPGRVRPHLRKYLLKAGIAKIPYKTFGLLFAASVFITLGIYLIFIFDTLSKGGSVPYLMILTFLYWSITQLTIILTIMVMVWVYIEIKIFQRTARIELVLPDFLEGVSVNLRAGMTFDKALWNSIEPEYGVLEKEIEIVAKKVMTGEDTEEALKEFSDKYNSLILKESIDLIIIGIKSGGEISELIDRVVDNVKTASYLKKELIANVMSYIIFITIIAVIVSPMLFALSFNLMLIIQSLGKKMAASGVNTAMDLGRELIKKEDFINYSRWAIAIIAIASSAIIADLREGSIKGGVKYIFFFIIIAFIVYEVMLVVFTAVFGGISNI